MAKLNSGLFTSECSEWETPPEIYDFLNEEFQFTLDPAASHENHKCEKYFTIEDDGLAQSWGTERVFLNPPYGREIVVWIKKAYEASLEGALVVCLIPARTDTGWWHDYVNKADEIRFLRGRVKFIRPDGTRASSAPFPSAIVIFKPGVENHDKNSRP